MDSDGNRQLFENRLPMTSRWYFRLGGMSMRSALAWSNRSPWLLLDRRMLNARDAAAADC